MPLFRLSADKDIYQEIPRAKASKDAANYLKYLIVTPVTTAEEGTIVDVSGNKTDCFDDVNKKTFVAVALQADVAGVAKKGEYIGIANLEPYSPPKQGDLGPAMSRVLVADGVSLRDKPSVSGKSIKKLKAGLKVTDLQSVEGFEPFCYSKSLKGYVAYADPKSGKPFWSSPDAPQKPAPKVNKTPATADYGVGKTPAKTPAKTAADEQPLAVSSGLSTTTILMIAGGAVLALLLFLPSGKGSRKRARA
jgi:hypothetical protein